MMNNIRVSVIVLSYNLREYLSSCLDSIISQDTNFKYEIIIADDNSFDGTPELINEYVNKYPDLIVPLFSYQNVGIAKNTIRAVAAARGDYIAHFDGDDLMLPGKLQKQVDILDQDATEQVSMVVHGDFIKFEGSPKLKALKLYQSDFVSLESLLLHGFVFSNISRMFRRSKIPSEGFIDSLKVAPEMIWHYQMAITGKICYLPERLTIIRKRKGSTSDLNNVIPERIEQNLHDLIQSIKYVERYANIDREIILLAYSRLNFITALAYLNIARTEKYQYYIDKSEKYINSSGLYKLIFHKIKFVWLIRLVLKIKRMVYK